MRILQLVWLCAGVGAQAALLQIDYGPGQRAEDVAALGVPVVFELEGACLVHASEIDAARLSYSGWRCRVLDRDTSGRVYVYASFEPGDDRDAVAEFGSVLAEDDRGVILATDESGIRHLPGVGCELARIALRPRVFSASGPEPKSRGESDSLVWTAVNRVSGDTLEARLRRLVAFYTRRSEHESCASAVNWLGRRLQEYRCDTVIYDCYDTRYAAQVIGVKRGRFDPRPVFVVCGHVDDWSQLPLGQYAPGSEDNASGVGCMLECARVTSDMDFDYTVWFVGWTGEEQGLIGSADYLYRCRERGDSIVLGMNFDMVSYGPQNQDSIRIVGKRANPPCSTWVEFFRAQADTFTTLKHIRYMVNDQQTSDHASFWNNGYTCIRGGYNVRTNVYHTTGDTIGPLYYVQCGTNNIPMYTEVVKATVATLVRLAGAHQMVGIEEGPRNRAVPTKAVLVRRILRLEPMSRPIALLDPAGRGVATLQAGTNDLSGLAPGVYYLRAGSTLSRLVFLR